MMRTKLDKTKGCVGERKGPWFKVSTTASSCFSTVPPTHLIVAPSPKILALRQRFSQLHGGSDDCQPASPAPSSTYDGGIEDESMIRVGHNIEMQLQPPLHRRPSKTKLRLLRTEGGHWYGKTIEMEGCDTGVELLRRLEQHSNTAPIVVAVSMDSAAVADSESSDISKDSADNDWKWVLKLLMEADDREVFWLVGRIEQWS